uniref:Nascent polypeptide-associated complex subunit beta n=1 Tax=Lactuca sativa TaxID=4236 RepID=A0A9R1VEY4_LACSA|nr:hypothetical protein LSAT_V11C500284650 [Lactuca sativa]
MADECGKAIKDGSTLKRIGVNAIPAIEEVNIFKDETVIQFLNPKASIAANTWVVSGSPQTKSSCKIFSQAFSTSLAPGGAEAAAATSAQADDDDEVPELVAGETFEAAAEEGQKS